MLILMSPHASPSEIDGVMRRISELGLSGERLRGPGGIAIAVRGGQRSGALDPVLLLRCPGVADTATARPPYPLVARDARSDPTSVRVAGPAGEARFGGGRFGVIAGPCAIESREQIFAAADAVKRAGAVMLRGGAWKPRTSPYSFQGMREEGVALLAEARARTGLPVVTEVVDPAHVERVAAQADLLQIGARNMQNFALLEAAGSARVPVLLKRAASATVTEWLLAAEYLLKNGNPDVILCERGIRSFEPLTRYTLDLGAIPLLRRLTHLPVVVDPSHGCGDFRSVPALARAALAAGADGLMVEVHPAPERALCDGAQALTPVEFAALMESLRALAPALGVAL